MSKTVLHKRSVAVVNGKPKLPTSAQTEYGEIAINYAKGYETLSIRNNQNEIVTFSSYDQIKKMLDDSELVMAAALNDLNTRLNASTGLITGVTLNGSALTINDGVVDLGNLMDEDDDLVIAEALVDLNNKITGITGVIEENELNTAAAVNDLYDKVDENEYLTSQAITQLESRIKELETALAGVEQILASI